MISHGQNLLTNLLNMGKSRRSGFRPKACRHFAYPSLALSRPDSGGISSVPGQTGIWSRVPPPTLNSTACNEYPPRHYAFIFLSIICPIVHNSIHLNSKPTSSLSTSNHNPETCEIISFHFLISTTLNCGADIYVIIFVLSMSLRTALEGLSLQQEFFPITLQFVALWIWESSLVLSKGPDFHYRRKRYGRIGILLEEWLPSTITLIPCESQLRGWIWGNSKYWKRGSSNDDMKGKGDGHLANYWRTQSMSSGHLSMPLWIRLLLFVDVRHTDTRRPMPNATPDARHPSPSALRPTPASWASMGVETLQGIL